MGGANIINLSRWRPPDPKKETAATNGDRRSGRMGSTSQQNTNNTGYGRGARPHVTAEPFGGSRFYATVLHWPDGKAERLQVFNDPSAAARNARKLDAAFAGSRP
jgi:hypothetical protein